MDTLKTRCCWVDLSKPHYIEYHDNEWGIAVHDDIKHFEMLTLEGAQAGLNWETILRKRAGYKAAFHNFQPKIIARMSDSELDKLMHFDGIIRNRLKIYSVRQNALAFLQIQKDFGTFDDFIWSFVNHQPIINHWHNLSDVPNKTIISEQISKSLRKRGMNFVGPTIMYAYMQAIGMVDDHLLGCYKRAALK